MCGAVVPAPVHVPVPVSGRGGARCDGVFPPIVPLVQCNRLADRALFFLMLSTLVQQVETFQANKQSFSTDRV